MKTYTDTEPIFPVIKEIELYHEGEEYAGRIRLMDAHGFRFYRADHPSGRATFSSACPASCVLWLATFVA